MDDDAEHNEAGGAVGVGGEIEATGADHAPVSERGRALIASNPGRYRVLSNGAVFDTSIKRIAAAPGIPLFTAEKITHIKREQAINKLVARQSAIDAISRMSNKPGGTWLDGWGTIVEAQAGLALDTSKGRASTEAARFVRSAAGLDDTKDDNEPASAVLDAAAQFSASFMARIAQLRAQAADQPAQDKPDDGDNLVIDADIPF